MYYPDKSVLLKITYEGNVTHKLFCTFYGGYTGSDSWKINSGISNVVIEDDFYLVYGVSGSCYKVRKGSDGTSFFSGSVLTLLIDRGFNDGYVVEILPLTNLESLVSVL